jgi:glycosidase
VQRRLHTNPFVFLGFSFQEDHSMQNARHSSQRALLTLVMAAAMALPVVPRAAFAAHTTNPTSVTIAGSLQSELGCPGDWQPDCASTQLAYDAGDDVWQNTFTVPDDDFEYKAALNGGWNENYGANAVAGGGNIALNADGSAVKFYYDHKSHWVTDNKNSIIATVPGSFQSELGCAGDWDPGCLRSWLQDLDGDGTYSFETTALPAGNYEGKVALNESWDVNYGQGGEQNGANIAFTVPANNAKVTFSFNAGTKVLTIQAETANPPGPALDNNVEWDGVKHDSRSTLYRTPGGAVSAGTPVKLRLRTWHNDVTGVTLRVYDINTNAQRLVPMAVVASDVACDLAETPADYSCDYWEATLNEAAPNNLWYRFIVTDGSDTDYYADNTPALDGGMGAMTEDAVDNSFALMFFAPGFSAPAWARNAVIYQIFPDRFRNGRSNNDARTGDPRYDDPVLRLPWGTLPEGFCRNYADAATHCPWRFDANPPAWSPTKEGPRGRDYMGGDLRGVDQQLEYLQSLGINTIYFNPIFDAGSNHSYDTQDYYKIDPYFGTQKDWENLVKHAERLGIRIVLDGVFNHMSSDSPFFDRYTRYSTVGACESTTSPYRDWFIFKPDPAGPCAGPNGTKTNYEGWFGFDSIPVLNKANPAVQQYFLTHANSVSRYWLNQGANGWRLDVSGDPSFPNGYWETFRSVTKSTKPDALLISETWQKDSTLLRMVRGDRLDTTMNYRLRDAVIGLLAPGPFDSKGFADSGRIIAPSEFAARLESIREDYPDAAFYTLMNLLDSHDTERLLWTLTPGIETRADKEFNAANVAAGKQALQLASLIQFTVPGAPTVYYGDEVGVTGDDDPDDRRTYPWAGSGGTPDMTLFAHYQKLAELRRTTPALTSGDFKVLAADDAGGVVAYGRKFGNQAAVVIINRSNTASAGAIPVAGYLPDGVTLNQAYRVGSGGGSATVAHGALPGSIGPKSALVLVTAGADLTPPAAPAGLAVTNEGNAQVSLTWNALNGAAGYNVYRSVVSAGGYERVNSSPLNGTTFSDAGLRNAQAYYYVVKALDAAGNESAASSEASAMPRLAIGWANVQWPPTLNHTLSIVNRTADVYGQVWIDGATSAAGATPSLKANVGFGPAGSNPANNAAWTWVDAAFNTDSGNNDEFKASLLPESVGAFDYVYRYSTTNGRVWLMADLNGPVPAGALPANPGKLTVNGSGDTAAPIAPASLRVTSASPAGIVLAWDVVTGDPSLYGYEVLRSTVAGGPYAQIARVTDASYTAVNVSSDTTYFYVVRAVDQSFNRSGNSAEVSARPELRTVTLMFNVTVPASTDGTSKSVYIAGFLDRLDGGLPQWNPGGVKLTRVNATTWTVTLTGQEGTQIEYKYALGSWDDVEKDGSCSEIGNRQLTLSHGTTGTQAVNDSVLNWRNVAPCGN